MPTTADLPDEILEEICEQNHHDYPSLLSTALVCRRWRHPAQRALFRHLEFEDPERASEWLASPARPRLHPKSVILDDTEGSMVAALRSCRGITSLEANSEDYDLLLLLSLNSLKYLGLDYPEYMSPASSSPTPPFRLSHLDITLDADGTSIIVSKLLEGSSATLSTLSIYGFGRSPSTVADTVAILARIPLPNLRHLIFRLHRPSSGSTQGLLQILPLLPSLQSLTVHNLHYHGLELVASWLHALPPLVATLRLDWWAALPHHTLLFDELSLSLGTPSTRSLRQLHLPMRFRKWVDDRAWAALEEKFAGLGVEMYVFLGVGEGEKREDW